MPGEHMQQMKNRSTQRCGTLSTFGITIDIQGDVRFLCCQTTSRYNKVAMMLSADPKRRPKPLILGKYCKQ